MNNIIKSITNKLSYVAVRAQSTITNTRGEGYVDSGVKILIAVVIGALLLGGIYALFEDTIMPTVGEKITDLFSYSGNNLPPNPPLYPGQ